MEKTSPLSPPRTSPFGLIDAALISMTFIWGLNFVIVKNAFAQITPFAFVTARFVLASLLFLAIVMLWQRGFGIARRDWGKVALAGFIGTGLYQPLFITGLSLSKVSSSALILACTPAFIALLNRMLGRENFGRRGWLGIGLSFGGILLIVQSNGSLLGDPKELWGDLFILAATICWSVYSVLAAPLLKTYSPLSVTSFATVVGTIPILLIGAPAMLAEDWSQVNLGGWSALLYSAVFAIVIAYLIWNFGLKKIGGARTALYNNLTPVVATLAAALFLGEPLTPLKIVGAAVIFAGLYLARTANAAVEPEG